MSTNTKLSHSAVSRYLKCPESYKNHYIRKLRPDATSSALLFGSALDAAIEVVLGDSELEYMTVFWENWNSAFINKKREDLPTNTKIAYAEKDMDWDLLQEADVLKLESFIKTKNLAKLAKGDAKETYKECQDKKKKRKYVKFSEAEHQYLNYANWLCMARKAPLMIEAFKKHILPKIKEVHSTQKQITLENDEGDVARGFIDIVVTLDDGKKYVLDVKTSARKYDEDAANNSPQLSLYAHHEGIEDVGYVVLYKNISKVKTRVCTSCGHVEDNNRVKTCSAEVEGKRCGGDLKAEVEREASVDLVLGKLNERYTQSVLENFDTVNNLIKQDIFYKNFDSCNNWFGQRCPYYKLCFEGDDTGLVNG